MGLEALELALPGHRVCTAWLLQGTAAHGEVQLCGQFGIYSTSAFGGKVLNTTTRNMDRNQDKYKLQSMYVLVSQTHEPNKIEKGHYKVDLVTLSL